MDPLFLLHYVEQKFIKNGRREKCHSAPMVDGHKNTLIIKIIITDLPSIDRLLLCFYFFPLVRPALFLFRVFLSNTPTHFKHPPLTEGGARQPKRKEKCYQMSHIENIELACWGNNLRQDANLAIGQFCEDTSLIGEDGCVPSSPPRILPKTHLACSQ